MFAEDMVKKQFVKKTQDILIESCQICHPEGHNSNATHGQIEKFPYSLFEKWVQKFATEQFVVDFMSLATVSGMNIMAPEKFEKPMLDYTAELPTLMSPTTLIDIYSKLWDLQTKSGLKIKQEEPLLELSGIHTKLEDLFEIQRIEAFEFVMETTLDLKSDAQLTMIKAYLTYGSSTNLIGFGTGEAFTEVFNKAVTLHLLNQEKILRGVDVDAASPAPAEGQ